MLKKKRGRSYNRTWCPGTIHMNRNPKKYNILVQRSLLLSTQKKKGI